MGSQTLSSESLESSSLDHKVSPKKYLLKRETWDFPGSSVVKILNSQCRGQGFRELRSHMPHSVAKKKKERNSRFLKKLNIDLPCDPIFHS